MCTVTFIPAGDKIFITSNRDEKNDRKKALPPMSYHYKDSELIFPKDAEAHGSWIAINRNGNAAVLLNGALKKFIPQPFYIKSRGLILLDIISDPNPISRFNGIDLHLTAPFTVIIWQHHTLFECRWDGITKSSERLQVAEARIWSSATLYDSKTMKKRAGWLAKFLRETPAPVMADIVNFHLKAVDGHAYDSGTMSRGGRYSTLSITSVELDQSGARMFYLDCNNMSNKPDIVQTFADQHG